MARPIYKIAKDIIVDWNGREFYAAAPYVRAMLDLESIDDNYGFDSARSIVSYFLANAGTWRGDTAKRIKNELKNLLK